MPRTRCLPCSRCLVAGRLRTGLGEGRRRRRRRRDGRRAPHPAGRRHPADRPARLAGRGDRRARTRRRSTRSRTPSPTLPVTVTDAQGTEVTVDRHRAGSSRSTSTARWPAPSSSSASATSVVGRDISDAVRRGRGPAAGHPDGHDLNAEAILELDPTVIITDTSLGPWDVCCRCATPASRSSSRLRPRPRQRRADLTHEVADALGVPDAGDAARGAHRSSRSTTVDRPRSRRSRRPTEGDRLRTVFLYVRGQAGVYYMFGEGSGADSLIDALGGYDVAEEIGWNGMKPLTDEGIVAAQPDLVLMMTSGLESAGGVDGLLERLPALAQTPAGQHRRFVDMEDSQILGFGPLTGDVLNALAVAVYAPEAARDDDADRAARPSARIRRDRRSGRACFGAARRRRRRADDHRRRHTASSTCRRTRCSARCCTGSASTSARCRTHPQGENTLWQVRFPRVVMALLAGAALATAGALMQGVFGNPLAEPGVVGVSAGAAVAAATVIVFGWTFAGTWTVAVCAFVGGLVTTLLVYALSRDGGRTEVVTLVLTGIAVNAMTSAGTGLPDVPRRHPGPRGDRLLDARQPQRLALGARRRSSLPLAAVGLVAAIARRPPARPARARRPRRPARRRRRRAAPADHDRGGRAAHRRGRRVLRDHRVRRPGRAAPDPDGRRPRPPAAGPGQRPRRRACCWCSPTCGRAPRSPTPTCRSACSPRWSAARSSSGCSAAPVVRRGAGHEPHHHRLRASASSSAATDPRPASTSTSRPASSSRSSAPTAPASRRCSASLAGDLAPDRRQGHPRRPRRSAPARRASSARRARSVLLQKQGAGLRLPGRRGGPDGPLAVAPHRPREDDDDARRRARRWSAPTSLDAGRPRSSRRSPVASRRASSFARVLAQAAPVLLLDEPTAALDIRHQESLLDVARACAAGRVPPWSWCCTTCPSRRRTPTGSACCPSGRVRADGPPARRARPPSCSPRSTTHPVEVVEHVDGPLVVLPGPAPRQRRRCPHGTPPDPARPGSSPRLAALAAPAQPALAGVDRRQRRRARPRRPDVRHHARRVRAAASSPSRAATAASTSSSAPSATGWRPSAGGADRAATTSTSPTARPRTTRASSVRRLPRLGHRGSANGGTMSAAGSWSHHARRAGRGVPGLDRDGNVRTIDCRKVTCGVITVGAHGVTNAPTRPSRPVRVERCTPQANRRRRPTPAPSTQSLVGRPSAGVLPGRGRAGRRRPARSASRRSASTASPRGPATCSPSPPAG